MSDLAAQLQAELSRASVDLGQLLGLDWHESTVERIVGRVGMVGPPADLGRENEDRLAALTAQNVIMALWPHENPSPEWWSTPLGRAIAAS